MKEIKRYKAKDDTIFDTESECIKYENLLNDVKAITNDLRPIPDDINFSNGHGYVQQNSIAYQIVRKLLLQLAKQYTDSDWVQEMINDPSIPVRNAGRIMQEGMPSPIYSVWLRLCSMDDRFREWGQMYFEVRLHLT